MSDGTGFGGFSLLELFKLEAESHCAALSDGLLALEKAPGERSVIEPLMRAAHSIKGAARIVGLDLIVGLAHAMEECFLAAQHGREVLNSARIDQLLEAVDVLGELRALSEADLPAWSQAQSERISAMAARFKEPAASAPAAPVPPPQPSATPTPAAPTPSASATAALAAAPSSTAAAVQPAEPAAVAAPATAAAPTIASAHSASSVRVAAAVLDRVLFLAGESSVEATRLESLRVLMARLKERERVLDNAVQSLREHLRTAPETGHAPGSGSPRARIDESFGELSAAAAGVQAGLADQSTRFEEAFRRLEELSGTLYTEVLRSRMRPFSEGITGFPRMVRDIARQLGKNVELRILGESVEVDRETLQKLESPLTHMIRNSLDHGIEEPAERIAAGKPPTATITLSARHQSGALMIEVRDDGRGIDPEAVRRKIIDRRMVDAATVGQLSHAELMEFLFLPGFSTKPAVTELSGRGVGLDVVQSTVREVSGAVTLESELGRGVRFLIRLPVTRSVIRAALVKIGGEMYAVPLARLDRIAQVPAGEVSPVQGRLQFTLEAGSVGLVHAADLLGGEQPPAGADADAVTALIIGSGEERCGLIVDEICGEEDLVVRPLDARLGAVPHIASAAIRSDGLPVLVVDVDDLLRSLKQSLQGGRLLGVVSAQARAGRKERPRVLVVDDSITVREVERQLLIRRGYDVDVAVDGREGFSALHAGRYDLLITDVDMPRMTGIELIRAVRREPKYAELPIIIVSYKDREEDRLLGMEAGASAYLTKSSFQDDSLIRMVEDLIGAPG